MQCPWKKTSESQKHSGWGTLNFVATLKIKYMCAYDGILFSHIKEWNNTLAATWMDLVLY